MKATIYIPDEKAELYEKAKEQLGGTISATFVRCIERELEAKQLETEKIVVEIAAYDDPGRVTKKAFQGRWIIGDEKQGEQHWFDQEKSGIRGGGTYSVAVTGKGKIVVVTFDSRTDWADELLVYENFEGLKNAEIHPDSLIAAVACGLDIDHIEHLDI